jgi:hypothetical protein
MKFASRLGLAAIAAAITITMLSCTSQSPSGPGETNQSLERQVGGYYPPPYGPDNPEVIPCEVSLGAPASEILNNGIPFRLSCEDMAMATMSIARTVNNSRGCLTRVEGSVTFGDTGHHYVFEMFILRTSDCAQNGGYILISSPLLGDEVWLRLPAITRVTTTSQPVAN